MFPTTTGDRHVDRKTVQTCLKALLGSRHVSAQRGTGLSLRSRGRELWRSAHREFKASHRAKPRYRELSAHSLTDLIVATTGSYRHPHTYPQEASQCHTPIKGIAGTYPESSPVPARVLPTRPSSPFGIHTLVHICVTP